MQFFGLFFRAYFFVNMSEKVGDLPMTEALQGLENTSPKYDAQKIFSNNHCYGSILPIRCLQDFLTMASWNFQGLLLQGKT